MARNAPPLPRSRDEVQRERGCPFHFLHHEHAADVVQIDPTDQALVEVVVRLDRRHHDLERVVDLAVKLMLKWPGLHYSTSAFAPRHYPAAILDYANTRGVEKVLYGGYFPMALSLERIVRELADLPLRDHVWEPFLAQNARRILGLSTD